MQVQVEQVPLEELGQPLLPSLSELSAHPHCLLAFLEHDTALPSFLVCCCASVLRLQVCAAIPGFLSSLLIGIPLDCPITGTQSQAPSRPWLGILTVAGHLPECSLCSQRWLCVSPQPPPHCFCSVCVPPPLSQYFSVGQDHSAGEPKQ